MSTFKYDIAISLCSDDLEYGKKLYDALNPKLEKKFLYPEQQKKIITEHGDEFFRRIFKEEARVVVILHRKEWGETKFTGLEKDAILDRIGQEGQGHDFIFMVPVDGSVPSWYPENRIYADPNEFSIEEIARFIEFLVAQRGGEVKPMTLEEKVEDFENRLQAKKEHFDHLCSPESWQIAFDELKELTSRFEEKAEHLEKTGLSDHTGRNKKFRDVERELRTNHCYGDLSLRKFTLIIQVLLLEELEERRNSQSLHLIKELSTRYPPREQEILSRSHHRFNFEGEHRSGWSELILYESGEGNDLPLESLIPGYPGGAMNIGNIISIEYYDLGPVKTSEELIEESFQELFDLYLKKYEPVLYPSRARS
ncbi:MAG: hypothetical protein ABEH43_09940 [Flavobacteriales bacterium]